MALEEKFDIQLNEEGKLGCANSTVQIVVPEMSS